MDKYDIGLTHQLYVAITIASQDIKIFMSAFDNVSNEQFSNNIQNLEGVDTLKQLHDIDDILRDLNL